jgi:hypothetical protein
LGKLGPLPDVQSILDNPEGTDLLTIYEGLIASIERPVTDVEARVLLGILGPGDCFEGEWALTHLIETAPGVAYLKQRVENSRRLGRIRKVRACVAAWL